MPSLCINKNFKYLDNIFVTIKRWLKPTLCCPIWTLTDDWVKLMSKIDIVDPNNTINITTVGIQIVALLVTLWIFYGHPMRIKRARWLFEFYLSITLAVIWISRTVAGSKNWMLLKESLRVSSHSILITLVKRNN